MNVVAAAVERAEPAAGAALRLSPGIVSGGAVRLGPHQLAYLRALINGIRWDQAAARYLFDEPRTTQRALIEQLSEWERAFGKAAALAGQPDRVKAIAFARLIPVPRRGKLPSSALTFEQWVDTQREGFYDTQTLRLGYEEYVREQRRASEIQLGGWNVDAGLAALSQLAPLLSVAPQAAHPLAAWFHPTLAMRLRAAGIGTVAELIAFMNRHGHRWYARIGRIGRRRAASIARWLNETADGSELTLSPPRRAPS